MFCESCLVCGLVVVDRYSVFGLHPIQGWGVTFGYIFVIFGLFHFSWGWFYFAFSSVFGGWLMAWLAPFLVWWFFLICIFYKVGFIWRFGYGLVFHLVLFCFSEGCGSILYIWITWSEFFTWVFEVWLVFIRVFMWRDGSYFFFWRLLKGICFNVFWCFFWFMFSYRFRVCTVGGECGFYFLNEFWPVFRS